MEVVVKEMLTNRIIVERFRYIMEKIKEDEQKNFQDRLQVKTDRISHRDAVLICLDKIIETPGKILKVFNTTKREKKTLVWIIIKEEKIICGVSDPVLYLPAREKITKMYEKIKERTALKELVFKIDFEESFDETAK